MKKYLFSLAALILISISAKAQFTLGIKGGLNVSKLNTDNLSESSVAGYDLGAWARIGKGFYLQPELYVSSKGGQFDFQTQNNTTTEKGTIRFTSLDVPLLLGESFGMSSFNVRIMAGPMYSYILSKNDNFSTNIKNAYSDFGNYNNSTLGYQAGAGVDLGNISVDARYEGGLTQINPKYGEKQNLFDLSLGFKIL
jgi:hypothetical protein